MYRDPSGATKLEAGQFTFEVSAVSGQKADGTAIDQTKIPMPEDENGNRIVTASNLEDGDIVFREITFDEMCIRDSLGDVQFVFYLGTGLNVFCVTSMPVSYTHLDQSQQPKVYSRECCSRAHPLEYRLLQ